MPMTNDIDELNIVKMVRGDSYNRYYEYFSKMNLEEEEIEDRVQMAMSFEDSLLPVLILALLLFQNGTYNRRDMRNRLASAYVNAVEDEGYLDDYTEDRAETFAKEVEGTTYEALKKAKEKAEAEKKSTLPIVPGVPTKTDGGSTSGVSIVGGEEDSATSMDRVERMSRTEAAIVLNHSEFETAKENGMTRKTWVTRKDKRVRESHDHMEGMTIPIDAPFILSGVEMMFPCDTTNDPPAKEVVNCRCSLRFFGRDFKVPGGVKTGAGSLSDSGRKLFKTGTLNGIIDSEQYRKKPDDSQEQKHFLSDARFEALVVRARSLGAIIVRGTSEAEEHLKRVGASAAIIGDAIIFGKNVTISDVLEETYHFEQNLAGLNDDKEAQLRSILNEIDAKEYILRVAKQYHIPRAEIELTEKQLESYRRELASYNK